jgi:hypothetical protein
LYTCSPDGRRTTWSSTPKIGGDGVDRRRLGVDPLADVSWLRPGDSENRWPVLIAIVAVIVIQHSIPIQYTAAVLLGGGAAIFLTNVIAFGIWYWELDRGGPFARQAGKHPYPDFLFPQMSDPGNARPDWRPTFVDYLYVSFTNVVAFSPTDTMPLARWAKGMMTIQSLVSMTTIALVIARAVNILG